MTQFAHQSRDNPQSSMSHWDFLKKSSKHVKLFNRSDPIFLDDFRGIQLSSLWFGKGCDDAIFDPEAQCPPTDRLLCFHLFSASGWEFAPCNRLSINPRIYRYQVTIPKPGKKPSSPLRVWFSLVKLGLEICSGTPKRLFSMSILFAGAFFHLDVIFLRLDPHKRNLFHVFS